MTNTLKIVGETWFNSSPLDRDDLTGIVVLVDFWTYSCVNCQRTLPYLRQWWNKYKNDGFLIIGVHTPEFEFEKDPKNVQQAINDLEVPWPVVLDNNYVNWNNFDNHYWPAKYLINKKGQIAYSHFGEGDYDETEAQIQNLVYGGQTKPQKVAKDIPRGKVCFIPTPELYCGYLRGSLANARGYQSGQPAEYLAPDKLQEDTIALNGQFVAEPEFIKSINPDSKLYLRFRGTEVNIVLKPEDKNVVAKIYLDEKLPPKEILGNDLSDEGLVRIDKARMYNLLKSDRLIEGVLKIQPQKNNFEAYAFTFSGCA